MDSNHRKRTLADLQSASFSHSDNYPHKKKSRLSDSNQRPADYKSAALPAELKRQLLKLYKNLI
jgi:hypothetical protein